MSIKDFLTESLKSLRANDNTPAPDVVKKLGDDGLYLLGASSALKAIGATAEHDLTEEARGLFKQKMALVNAHQSLVDKLETLDQAPETPSAE